MTNRDALWVDDTGKTVIVEVDEEGNRVPPLPSDPFGGKGDHDGDGKVGGAAPPVEPEAKPKRPVKTR